MVNTFKASYEYLEANNTVHTIDIVYLADTPVEAMNASVRFWEGRNKAMPEYFHEALCVTVYPYVIAPISTDGRIQGGIGMRLFEWKCDNFGGHTLQEFVQYMTQKLARAA